MGADASHADFTDASLITAFLNGANLTGRVFDKTRLLGATFDSPTRWPENFNPILHGAVRIEDPTA